jgi:predicted nucleic acid-binding Zn ribbon protein
VFSGWEGIVGGEIAAHCRPVSLHDGVLVLAVDHPAWANQLRFMTAELLTRITEAAGRPGAGSGAPAGPAEVTDIHIRVVGQPTPETPFRRGRKHRS